MGSLALLRSLAETRLVIRDYLEDHGGLPPDTDIHRTLRSWEQEIVAALCDDLGVITARRSQLVDLTLVRMTTGSVVARYPRSIRYLADDASMPAPVLFGSAPASGADRAALDSYHRSIHELQDRIRQDVSRMVNRLEQHYYQVEPTTFWTRWRLARESCRL